MNERSNKLRPFLIQLPLFLSSAVFSLWFTPYLLDKLGKEEYAFYPLSLEIVNLAAVIAVIFTSMLSVYAGEGLRENNLNEIFNSSLYSNVMTAMIALIPLALITAFADSILSVPRELTVRVKLLFAAVSLSFCVSQIKSSFTAINVVINKRYVNGLLRAAEKATAIILPVILFSFLKPSVAYAGLAVLAGMLISLTLSAHLLKKDLPGLDLSKRHIRKSTVRMLFFSGVWNSLAQIIILISLNISAPLANILYGAHMQSEYSLAAIIPSQMRSLLVMGLNYLIPFFALSFQEEGSTESFGKTLHGIMRTVSFVMGTVCALFCGLGESFLKIWIGGNYTPVIYNIMVIYSVAFFAVGVFSVIYGILVVYNKVRVPTVLMLVSGILIIPLAILFSSGSGPLSVYGVAFAALATGILQYAVILPGYFCDKTKTKKGVLYRPFFGGLGVAAVGAASAYVLKSFFEIDNYLKLGAAIAVVIIICAGTAARRLINFKDIKTTIDILRMDNDGIQGTDYDPLI